MGKPCNIYRLRGKPYDYQYQFGCGILKMVGPKEQDFWPKINIQGDKYVSERF